MIYKNEIETQTLHLIKQQKILDLKEQFIR